MLLYNIFQLKYFALGILLGMLLLQLYPDNREEVIIYPSEKVQENTQYIDSADNCFEFSIKEIECPSNVYSIRNVPIQ